jgi:hypothetical protein
MSDNHESNNPKSTSCPMMGAVSPVLEFEKIPPEEADQIEVIAKLTTVLQDKRIHLPRQEGRILRGVHAKSHGCVTAQFIVNQDIDEKYQVGLFADPGRAYKAQVRFSNASTMIDKDSKFVPGKDEEPGKWEHGSRGMAIKVYDVGGDVIDADCDGKNNQDFLMINTPEFAFSDVRSYLFLTKALDAHKFGVDPTALFALGKITLDLMTQASPPRRTPSDKDFTGLKTFLQSLPDGEKIELPEGFTFEDVKKVVSTLILLAKKIQLQPTRNPLQVQYFGASSYLFGKDRVMKFSAAPSTHVKQNDFETVPPESVIDNFLHKALTESMDDDSTIEFDFKIIVKEQGFGEENVLIEDTTTTWKKDYIDEIDQYERVAKLIIKPNQDVSSEGAKKQCEDLVFTPWHALKAHQPIGGINRLRRSVYRNSARHRYSRESVEQG